MEEKNKLEKKEISLNDLAVMMTAGFEKASKQMDEKIEWLARAAQNNFSSIEGRLDRVEGRLTSVDSKLFTIEANLNKKVDRFDHKELEIRVEKVEEKLKLKQNLKFA